MEEYISKDQKIDNRPPRMFVANDPGLDFLNSIGAPADTVVEWIANGEDLLAWLVEAKLVESVQAAATRANSFSGELGEVAAQARALREWFRGFVLVHMGRPLTAKALKLLEPLNRYLSAMRDTGRLWRDLLGLPIAKLHRDSSTVLSGVGLPPTPYFCQSPRRWLTLSVRKIFLW
jgi:hypothetical protein